jgi:hypothetical protein
MAALLALVMLGPLVFGIRSLAEWRDCGRGLRNSVARIA